MRPLTMEMMMIPGHDMDNDNAAGDDASQSVEETSVQLWVVCC